MRSLSFLPRIGLRATAQMLSPGAKRGSLLVLIFHRVFPQVDPLLNSEPDAVRFATEMDLIASLFNVLPLSEALIRLKQNSLPARAACITFDDGYTNNLTVATPILKARNLPATVFISTGFSGGGRMWNDTVIETVRNAKGDLDLSKFDAGTYTLDSIASRRAAVDGILGKVKYLQPVERLARVNEIAAFVGNKLPDDLMMSQADLRSLRAEGIDIGAHTINHPILTRLNDDDSRREIYEGKRQLEDMIGEKVKLFAYPNGRPQRDYEARHVKIVRECGFEGAVSTAWGAARADSDSFQIPRVAAWDTNAIKYALRLIKSNIDPKAQSV